jgi:hypothetical protein
VAEISSLLNCRTGNSVPRVRIPPSPQLKRFGVKTEVREVAQAGSAPGLGPGGRRFESCLPDKQNEPWRKPGLFCARVLIARWQKRAQKKPAEGEALKAHFVLAPPQGEPKAILSSRQIRS